MLDHTVDKVGGCWYFFAEGEKNAPVHITRILENVGTVLIDYDDEENVVGVEILAVLD